MDLKPHQKRASIGEKHPVYDFLFDYYSFRPGLLRRWQPGIETVLEGSQAENKRLKDEVEFLKGKKAETKAPVEADFDDYDASEFSERTIYKIKDITKMPDDVFNKAINTLLKK